MTQQCIQSLSTRHCKFRIDINTAFKFDLCDCRNSWTNWQSGDLAHGTIAVIPQIDGYARVEEIRQLLIKPRPARKLYPTIIWVAAYWANCTQFTGQCFQFCLFMLKIDNRQQFEPASMFYQLELIAWFNSGRFWHTQGNAITGFESTGFADTIHKLYIRDIQ